MKNTIIAKITITCFAADIQYKDWTKESISHACIGRMSPAACVKWCKANRENVRSVQLDGAPIYTTVKRGMDIDKFYAESFPIESADNADEETTA